MRKGILCILWALLGPALQAAEIVGWKTPLREFVFEELNAPGVVRCEPPEPSAFFNEGDELWDLGGVPERHRLEIAPPLEWVVWNASTRRLVTKSGWDGVWELNRFLGSPGIQRRCRIVAEILRVDPTGSPPAADAIPVASITLRCSGNADFESAVELAAGDIQIEGDAEVDPRTPHVRLKFESTFAIDSQPRRTLAAAVTLRDSVPLWVARDADSANGLDFQLTAHIEFPDGTPAAEVVLIERNGRLDSLVPSFAEAARVRLADGTLLFSMHVEPSSIVPLVPGTDLEEEWDPFAESKPPMPTLREKLSVQEVLAPESIATFFPNPLWDIRQLLMQWGAGDEESMPFAAYDPILQRIAMISTDEDDFDRVTTLLSSRSPWPELITIDLRGKSSLRLVGHPMHQCELVRSGANGKPAISLEVELFGTKEAAISLEDRREPGALRLKTILPFAEGVPAELLSASDEAGEIGMRVTSSVLEVPR